jgi:hypothetical protein
MKLIDQCIGFSALLVKKKLVCSLQGLPRAAMTLDSVANPVTDATIFDEPDIYPVPPVFKIERLPDDERLCNATAVERALLADVLHRTAVVVSRSMDVHKLDAIRVTVLDAILSMHEHKYYGPYTVLYSDALEGNLYGEMFKLRTIKGVDESTYAQIPVDTVAIVQCTPDVIRLVDFGTCVVPQLRTDPHGNTGIRVIKFA